MSDRNEAKTPPEKSAGPRHALWKSRPRWLRVTAWTLGIIFVLVTLIVTFRDFLVLQTVRRFGSALTGTKVELKNFQTSLSGLSVAIEGLSVANPPGYHTPMILELERLYVDLEFGTVFSDVLVVENAEIRGLHINYEQKYNGSNLADLQRNINDFINSDDNVSEEEAEEVPEESSQSLLIRRLEISGNSVTLANTETGQSMTIPMPNFSLDNIGGKGYTASDVLKQIYEKISNMVVASFTDVGGHISAMSASATDRIKEAGKSAFTQLNRTGADAAGALKQVGQKTVDGMKDAGNAVKDAGGKAVDAIHSLWK